MPMQEAMTRNKKEQGAIEAGNKLARELGLNLNLSALEADEVVVDPKVAPLPQESPRKDVVGTHSRHSSSISIPSPISSPSRNASAASVARSPSKDISSHAVLDLNVDAGILNSN